ncbi:MAG TPA: ParB N-terminal domain-containing protein [Pyrinomonadaceae bacterium]|nr:ParB N-terminal domain-containing protein [Pyrinomonadaceae bacterium]
MPTKNKSIQYEKVENLRFDPENPRFPTTLNGEDEDEVLGWMLKDATIVELMGSIGEKGYFPGEPLLVVPAKKTGMYYVVEGNRRLCAVKLLLKPNLAPTKKKSVQIASTEAKHRPQDLPVLVYDSRDEILDYLGYRHITGIKEWDALAKAKYLEQLFERDRKGKLSDRFKRLAKGIGSKPNYVARLLTGLHVFDEIAESDFFDIEELDEDSVDFSILVTALSYKELTAFLGLKASDDPELPGLNKKRLRELTQWLFEKIDGKRTRLGESRELKKLNAVVQSPKALAAFRRGSDLSDAALLTGEPTGVFRTAVNTSKTQLQTARDYSHLVEGLTTADSDVLVEIQGLARDLKIVVDSKVRDAG